MPSLGEEINRRENPNVRGLATFVHRQAPGKRWRESFRYRGAPRAVDFKRLSDNIYRPMASPLLGRNAGAFGVMASPQTSDLSPKPAESRPTSVGLLPAWPNLSGLNSSESQALNSSVAQQLNCLSAYRLNGLTAYWLNSLTAQQLAKSHLPLIHHSPFKIQNSKLIPVLLFSSQNPQPVLRSQEPGLALHSHEGRRTGEGEVGSAISTDSQFAIRDCRFLP